MRKFSFLHISDLHLCEPFKNNIYLDGYFLREEMWKSIDNMVNFANEKKVDFIFISGDLFNKDYFTKAHALRFIDALKKFSGKYIFIIFGNHDFVDDKNIMLSIDLPENMIFQFTNEIEEIKLEDYDLSIFLHSWTREIEHVPILETIKFTSKRNILLIHSGMNIDTNYMPILESSIRRFDYVALGHIHKPMKIYKNAFYPGSLTPLNISEEGDHGGIYGVFDGELKTKFVRFSGVKYITKTIDIKNMSLSEIVDTLVTRGGVNVLRLILVGEYTTDIDVKDLEYRLKDYYSAVQIIDNRRFTSDFIENNSEIVKGISEYLNSINCSEEDKTLVLNNAIKFLLEN